MLFSCDIIPYSQIYGYTNVRLRNRIVELAHSVDWLAAYLEYGTLQSHPQYLRSIKRYTVVNDQRASASASSTTTSLEYASGLTQLASSRGSQSGGMSSFRFESNNAKVPDASLSRSDDCADDTLTIEDVAEFERGRLRCLIELGQLEAALDQVCICSGSLLLLIG
jgi:hypothetical protein